MARWDEVIADWFNRPPEEFTRRTARTRGLPGKADALIGMRRSGKTSLLRSEVAQAQAGGAPPWSALYVSLEDDRLGGIEVGDLGGLVEAWYRRYPEAAQGEGWLILDEVQEVTGWERFVRRVLDEGRLRVSVTGSSAKMLSREIATSLRGRSWPVEVLPFGFAEWLDHQGLTVPERWPPDTAERAVLANAVDRFLVVGGFPEVVRLEAHERGRILKDYVDVVLLRDVVERHGATNVATLRRLVRRLTSSPGAAFSVHKFHNDLKSQGVAVGKDTLYEYLDHVEDAFLAFRVPIRTDSERVRATNPPKVYPIDPGLSRSFTARPEVGHLLEDAVYLELRRRGGEISWYRTQKGHEVDFVVDGGPEPVLIQVCADLGEPETRGRELRALEAAMTELGVRQGLVVTLGGAEALTNEAGEVRVVPAWAWLLGR